MNKDLKEAIELLGRLYDALVEMPALSAGTRDLLGETDDFIKKFDEETDDTDKKTVERWDMNV